MEQRPARGVPAVGEARFRVHAKPTPSLLVTRPLRSRTASTTRSPSSRPARVGCIVANPYPTWRTSASSSRLIETHTRPSATTIVRRPVAHLNRRRDAARSRIDLRDRAVVGIRDSTPPLLHPLRSRQVRDSPGSSSRSASKIDARVTVSSPRSATQTAPSHRESDRLAPDGGG